MEPAGHSQLVSIGPNQVVVDLDVFFDPLAHKDFQDGGETFVGNRFFKKMSYAPGSVFLHRWGSHPHLTQNPVQGEGPDGKKLRAVGIRSLSLHRWFATGPKLYQKTLLRSCSSLNKVFRKNIEVWFGVVLLDLFGIGSRGFQC
jgi:hypothetical protein